MTEAERALFILYFPIPICLLKNLSTIEFGAYGANGLHEILGF
jgi:hypothetical protein